MRTRKFQSRVLILSGWAMLMLILTLGALSWQSQAALAKPLRTDVSGEITTDTTWTLAGSPIPTPTLPAGALIVGQNRTSVVFSRGYSVRKFVHLHRKGQDGTSDGHVVAKVRRSK